MRVPSGPGGGISVTTLRLPCGGTAGRRRTLGFCLWVSLARVPHYPESFSIRVAISTAPDTPTGGWGRVDVLMLLYATAVPLLTTTELNRHATQLLLTCGERQLYFYPSAGGIKKQKQKSREDAFFCKLLSLIEFGEDTRGGTVGTFMLSFTGESSQVRCSHETEPAGGVAGEAVVVGRVKSKKCPIWGIHVHISGCNRQL